MLRGLKTTFLVHAFVCLAFGVKYARGLAEMARNCKGVSPVPPLPMSPIRSAMFSKLPLTWN